MSRDARGLQVSSLLDSARVPGVPGVKGVGVGSRGVSCSGIVSRSPIEHGSRVEGIAESRDKGRRKGIVDGMRWIGKVRSDPWLAWHAYVNILELNAPRNAR